MSKWLVIMASIMAMLIAAVAYQTQINAKRFAEIVTNQDKIIDSNDKTKAAAAKLQETVEYSVKQNAQELELLNKSIDLWNEHVHGGASK